MPAPDQGCEKPRRRPTLAGGEAQVILEVWAAAYAASIVIRMRNMEARTIERPTLLRRPRADEVGVAYSGGVRIAWRRHGNGSETLLFVPTWNFVDSRVVRHQVDGLRDRFRLITYDARGSGESDHPRTGYRFDDHVADALAVLDATNTPTASVVAASLGTHAAVLLAARHPARVRRLVLVAPPMEVRRDAARESTVSSEAEDRPEGAEEPDWRTDYERFVPWFISAVFPEPGSETTIDEIIAIARQADHALLLQQSSELDWDSAPSQLGAVRCPTLVIHGAADGTLDLESVRAVAAAIPSGRLVLLEGLGHRPDISRPAVVNPILVDFLERPDGRRADGR